MIRAVFVCQTCIEYNQRQEQVGEWGFERHQERTESLNEAITNHYAHGHAVSIALAEEEKRERW